MRSMNGPNLDENAVTENFWFLRRPTQFLLDVIVLTAAFLLAYLPAINVQLGEYYLNTTLTQLPFVIFIEFSALFLSGAYSIIWRYISIEDLKVFIRAATISGIILIALRFLLIYSEFRLWQIPISVILLDLVIGFGGILAVRVLRRSIYELSEKNQIHPRRRRGELSPALIIGAGRMAHKWSVFVSARRTKRSKRLRSDSQNFSELAVKNIAVTYFYCNSSNTV